MGRAARLLVLALLALGVALAAFATSPVRAGDDTVAAALLKQGKAALQKKGWDEAITLFDRALREQPEMIEAEYQRAVALEKKGARADALAAYRRFAARLAEKTEAGKAAADETALGPPADKKIALLAGGEQELAKLEDQFAAQLLAYAKKVQEKDPPLALEALRHLLRARPAHEEALQLFAKLGGTMDAGASAKAAPQVPSPFAKLVKSWNNLIGNKSITASALHYTPDGFSIDTQGGIVVESSEHFDLGAKYVMECEFRVTEEKERSWLCGICVGKKDGDMVTGFLQRGQAILNHGNTVTKTQADLGFAPLKPGPPDAWHRVGLRVDGTKLELWLDGAKVVAGACDWRPDLVGEIGLFQQRCRAEWRMLRAGKVE